MSKSDARYCPEHDRYQCSICPSPKSLLAGDRDRHERIRAKVREIEKARERRLACRHGVLPGRGCRSCRTRRPTPSPVQRVWGFLRGLMS